MSKGVFFLTFLALAPLWLPMGLERLGMRVSVMPLVSSWVQAEQPQNELWPPTEWREASYLAHNPDVAAAVRQGYFRNGYEHYMRHGREEGRQGGGVLHASPPTPASPPTSVPVLMPAVPDAATPIPVAETPPVQPTPVQAGDDTPARTPAPPAIPAAASASTRGTMAPPSPPLPRLPPAGRRPEAPPAPAKTEVSGIRVGVHQGFTRIVLDVSGAIHVGSSIQRGKGAIDIDLPQAVWKTTRRGWLVQKDLSYETEDLTPLTSRLKIRAATAILLKSSFVLPPENGRGYRVVLDVVPGPNTKSR